MKAEIISVGTELILGSTLNTNTHYITQKLTEIGIDVLFHTSVVDDKNYWRCYKYQFEQGRLNNLHWRFRPPTNDDITKEVVSDTLGLKLILDKSLEKEIKEYFF